MLVMLSIYMLIKRVNYESILCLYKSIYRMGQQRYHGVVYSEKDSRDIQISAETLVGKAKVKNSDWCERLFDKGARFMFYKEWARIMANFNKLVTYGIFCLLIGVSRFYIPKEYIVFAFLLLIAVAVNFDIAMNKSEANLLLRGFIGRYVVWDIIKSKLLIYTIANFILMLPSILFGWKWAVSAFVSSFFTALISLYKCFKMHTVKRPKALS